MDYLMESICIARAVFLLVLFIAGFGVGWIIADFKS